MKTQLSIEEMQNMYDALYAFRTSMRNNAISSIGTKHDFFDEFKSHTDKISMIMGTLSAHITIRGIEDKVYG